MELQDKGASITYQDKPLFLQAIHGDFKCLIRNTVQMLLLPFGIVCIQPFPV